MSYASRHIAQDIIHRNNINERELRRLGISLTNQPAGAEAENPFASPFPLATNSTPEQVEEGAAAFEQAVDPPPEVEETEAINTANTAAIESGNLEEVGIAAAL